MKVALVTDWYLPRLGGLELHVRDLAGELSRAGCEVHVVTPTRADPDQQGRGLPAVEVPEPERVTVHRLPVPLAPRYRFAFTPGAFRTLSALLERERFDVVHCMVGVITPLAMGGVRVAVGRSLPTVVTFHSRLFVLDHVLRALDLAVGWSRWPVVFSAVSRAVATEVRGLVGERPVHVLPNGVDAGRWRTAERTRDPHELRLVSVMRLNPRKRGAALLRSVAAARAELDGGGPRVSLTLIGEGTESARLRRLAARLGLDGHLTFAGYLPRPDIRRLFERSDVFVTSSVLESFGLAALEARAAGLPVVARAASGVGEFVGHEREGLLAASDAGLTAQLVRLARDPALVASLTRRVRETPVPHAWGDAVRAHLEAYRTALATSAPRGRPEASGRSRPPTPLHREPRGTPGAGAPRA